ncbi:MAG: DegT/DnrJ/EryC1/StrS family aminotransferase [Phycisphaerales bacterium]
MVPSETPAHIPLTRPWTDDRELEAVRAVLESGHLAQGPRVAAFEASVRELTGAGHAIATSSCTTALHLALAAGGVTCGDEVAVADFTFPATANVVVQQGATPVLVDIDPATYAMCPADLERRITPRTRAIMSVDPVGSPADHERLRAIARAHDLLYIDDAACAIGGTSAGRPLGSGAVADITCLSFHARKVITTGEGGMLLTDDDAVAERAMSLRTHGGVRTDGRFSFESCGFNYRLSDIQAAVGLVQMERLPEILTRRRRLALGLTERIAAGLSWPTGAGPDVVQLPGDPPWGPHLYQSYVVCLPDAVNRDAVIAELRAAGVESTIGTYACHAEPAFERLVGTAPGDRPHAWRAFRQAITLPLHPRMTDAELDRVASVFTASVGSPATVAR